MATTTAIQLTDEQREQLAKVLRLSASDIPREIGVVAVSPEAGEKMGLPKAVESKFLPAMIIT